MNNKRTLSYLGGLLLLLLLLASCGGIGASSAGTATSANGNAASSAMHNAAPAQNASNSSSMAVSSKQQANKVDTASGAQYLVKTLNVTIAMNDPQKAANAVQAWIGATDPHSTSAGMNYTQVGNASYDISMSFSVQASLYPQIQHYLQNYAQQQKGQLISFQETVQDVTNDFIDTQSRLKNLHGEQARLLTFMNNAQSLNDTLTIEQHLTDVEGQIEQLEEHSNNLNHQLAQYTVTVTIQPLIAPIAVSPAAGWSAGQTFHSAFAASLTFAQAVATFIIWLLAYSIYIVPVVIVAWLVRRWRKRANVIPSPTPKA